MTSVFTTPAHFTALKFSHVQTSQSGYSHHNLFEQGVNYCHLISKVKQYHYKDGNKEVTVIFDFFS